MPNIILSEKPTNKKFVDLTGRKFGLWTVESFAGYSGKNRVWHCVCDCGTKQIVFCNFGKRKNPGCQKCLPRGRTHGFSNTPTYQSWASMRARCSRKNHVNYDDYGGRGIAVCERWFSFELFLADMGERPSKKHSIDRFPNKNGNYEPGNCRWATQTEQMRNTRRNNLVEIHGETKTIAEWSLISGVSQALIGMRLKWKWLPKTAVFSPANLNNGRLSIKERDRLAEEALERYKCGITQSNAACENPITR